ncbi:periplasmic chaperone for outer membrane proteins SurA [Fluviicoccus keumensis]|uniref:Chaperone SurA n=1 Tax=Fluviicoccus keumensis TaxID=1435465 RepID=A0A4Q7ZB62_9GAMM|nr:peptidylprolyl isomerase [Fluviicoccus keumensis]RZU47361.1 periplasmic chaperone for outer membrane proteins SurA [Fluviicoccus keumensis]
MRLSVAPLLFLLLTAPVMAGIPLDRIAAVVDEDVILESEVKQRIADVENQFQTRHQTLPDPADLRNQVLEQLILQNLQRGQAQKAGVRIDDNTLNASMTDIARQNGLTLDEFRQRLETEHPGSYNQVREQVRTEMIISRYRNRRLQERIRITDQDIDSFLASPQGAEALATEYRLAHILVSVPEAATPAQLDKARKRAEEALVALRGGQSLEQVAARYSTGDDALKGGDLGWRKEAQLPAVFADQIRGLKTGEYAGPIQTPAGFHILALLDRRGAEQMVIHQRQVRHILVKPSEVLSSEDAQQKAADLRSKLEQHPEDFPTLARTNSDDPGSARNGGDLGWVSPGEMVPSFEEMMKKTPINGISPVFESQFGWHILQVLGERDQDMTREYRRNLARQALYNRKFDEELELWQREIRADAYVEIKPVEAP